MTTSKEEAQNKWLQDTFYGNGKTEFGKGTKDPFKDKGLLDFLANLEILKEYGYSDEAASMDAKGPLPELGLLNSGRYTRDQLTEPKNSGGNGKGYTGGDYGNYKQMVEVNGGQDPTLKDAQKYQDYMDTRREPRTLGGDINNGIGNGIQGLLRLLGLGN